MTLRTVSVRNTFLSTLSLRRATGRNSQNINRGHISIHALLAESDILRKRDTPSQNTFLSTLSLRRATTRTQSASLSLKYFYPRSPCGERLMVRQPKPVRNDISIHALLAESDSSVLPGLAKRLNFYPRSPCGERPALPTTDGLFFLFLSTLSLRRATQETHQ